jgi:hypothetical protein
MTTHIHDKPGKTSIRYIGLKRYLNRLRETHNGFDYDDFIRMVDQPEAKRPTKASLAKIFNVSRHTMTKWLDVHFREKSN